MVGVQGRLVLSTSSNDIEPHIIAEGRSVETPSVSYFAGPKLTILLAFILIASLVPGLSRRLAEDGPDKVQRLNKSVELVELWYVSDIQDNPGVIVKRCVDEVRERTVSSHRNCDPSANRRVIASPLTDEGRRDITCCRQPFRHKFSLTRSKGPGWERL